MKIEELQSLLHRDIQLFKALSPTIDLLNEREALLSAPLTANSNHLGTAFGGSQYSVAMLSCYSLIVHLLSAQNLLKGHEVVVKRSSSEYKRPVSADFTARCQWPSSMGQKEWLTDLRQTGRKAIDLKVELKSQGKLCSEFVAEFIVFARGEKN